MTPTLACEISPSTLPFQRSVCAGGFTAARAHTDSSTGTACHGSSEGAGGRALTLSSPAMKDIPAGKMGARLIPRLILEILWDAVSWDWVPLNF